MMIQFKMNESLGDVVLLELQKRFNQFDHLRFLGLANFTILYTRDEVPMSLSISPQFLNELYPDGFPAMPNLESLIDLLEERISRAMSEQAYTELAKLDQMGEEVKAALVTSGKIRILAPEVSVKSSLWVGYFLPFHTYQVDDLVQYVESMLGDGKFMLANFYRYGLGFWLLAQPDDLSYA